MTEKPIKEKSQSSTKEIVRTIIISFVTALFTQLLTYFFWTRQFESNKKQKLLEYKISSFDKFSSSAGKALYLSEFAFRLKIEQYIEERRLADSLVRQTGVRVDTLEANLRYDVQKNLQITQPLLYEKYMKFLEFQNEYNTSAVNASLLFSQSIRQKINHLTESFHEEELRNQIMANLKETGKDIFHFDKDRVINSIFKTKVTEISTILNEMVDEINAE